VTAFHPLAHTLMFALLAAATAIDLRSRRIPNLISLGGLLLALILAATGLGATTIGPALIGMGIGFGLLLPLYAKGAMGAGDVKLMAAVGAFLGGPALALGAVAGTFIAGAVLALLYMVLRNGAGATARRYADDIRIGVAGGGWKGLTQPKDAQAPQRFPYATAIASGALSALWFAPFWQRLWGVS
jgi:prepilin peptidase CpaA